MDEEEKSLIKLLDEPMHPQFSGLSNITNIKFYRGMSASIGELKTLYSLIKRNFVWYIYSFHSGLID